MNALALAAVLAATSSATDPARHVIVVCAPGSPGTTAEAQPTMDAFAAAVASKAGLPASALAAVYDEKEDGGAARLRARDAAVGLVSLPFYLKHERDLDLRARLQAAPEGRAEAERWALVVKKGRVGSPAALAGFTIVSTAGYAPAFVRGPALAGFGPIPAGVKIAPTSAVLTALRRAAAGEPVAVLLDGAQEAALASLPFAADLEVVTRSPPLPSGIVALVDARLPAKAWSALEGALRSLPSDAAGAAALESMRMARFLPVDEKALAAARKSYLDASR